MQGKATLPIEKELPQTQTPFATHLPRKTKRRGILLTTRIHQFLTYLPASATSKPPFPIQHRQRKGKKTAKSNHHLMSPTPVFLTHSPHWLHAAIYHPNAPSSHPAPNDPPRSELEPSQYSALQRKDPDLNALRKLTCPPRRRTVQRSEAAQLQWSRTATRGRGKAAAPEAIIELLIGGRMVLGERGGEFIYAVGRRYEAAGVVQPAALVFIRFLAALSLRSRPFHHHYHFRSRLPLRFIFKLYCTSCAACVLLHVLRGWSCQLGWKGSVYENNPPHQS